MVQKPTLEKVCYRMISRRALLASMAAFTAAPAWAKPELVIAEAPFSVAMIHDMARDLASRDYMARPTIPQEWLDLTYDEFAHIWFDPRNGIWIDEDRRMKMDLFNAGLYVPRPTEVNLVEDGVAKTLGFDINLFATTDEFPDLPINDRAPHR